MALISLERAALVACLLVTKICSAFTPIPSVLFSRSQPNLSDFERSRNPRKRGKYNDEDYGPPLEQKIANLRKCITPVLGREIEYYEFINRHETGGIDEEYGNFFIGFKEFELVLCINWTCHEAAYVGLWTRQKVDEYFAKETVYDCFQLPDGTLDEFSRSRTSFTQKSQTPQEFINGTPWYGGYVDIIGSKIVGVYLGNASTFETTKSPVLDRWTELFLDLGQCGCLNIQRACNRILKVMI